MSITSNPDKFPFSNWKRRIVVTLATIATAIVTMAQINPVMINVTVMPPFTSSVSDYLNNPNKISIRLTHVGIDLPDFELYLKMSIVGDNGISAMTEDGYKPLSPIALQKGTVHLLNMNNIGEAFSIQHIVIQGITLQELISGAGFPEGNYQICLSAYDFNTDRPLSGEEPVCSSLFPVTNLEPPIITSPVCGDPQISYGNQLINISWTKPALSPARTTYHFEMVEIPENINIDPNEAFLIAKSPVLYEESTTQTMLFLTADKVSLNSGYTYAMRVSAEDPTGLVHFRNKGTSEVCYFKYEKLKVGGDTGEKSLQFVLPAYNDPDSVLTANPVSGFHTSWRLEPFDTLAYKDLLDNYPGCIFLVEFFKDSKGKTPILTTTTTKPFFRADPIVDGLPFESEKSYWERVSIVNQGTKEIMLSTDLSAFKYQYGQLKYSMVQRTLSGKLEYKFEKDDPGSYPVANAGIRLVAKFILNDTDQGLKIEVPEDKIPSNLLNNTIYNLTGQPLSSGTTTANGNFILTFNWPDNLSLGDLKQNFSYSSGGKRYTGKLSLVLVPILDNPYYSGIDREISLNQNPFDLGTLTTYVYSYKLNAVIYEGYKDAPGIKKNLEDKDVYVLRKTKKPGMPPFEGTIFNNNAQFLVPLEITKSGYSMVATGKTKESKDIDGKDVAAVTFTRLIQNLVFGDDYYLWIKGTGILTVEAFRYNASMSQKADKFSVSLGTFSDISPYSFTLESAFTFVTSQPPMSGISGRIVYEFPAKAGNSHALNNRNISLISCLVSDEPGEASKLIKSNVYETFPQAFPGTFVLYTAQTDASGNFSFQFPNILPAHTQDPKTGQYELSTGKLNRNEAWISWESDPGTEFHITYSKKQVKVKRVLRIVIMDEAGIFLSPCDNIEIEPLKSADVGTLAAEVFSYKLKGGLYNHYYDSQDTVGNYKLPPDKQLILVPHSKPIQGAECFSLRSKSQISYLNLPSDEGQNIVGNLPDYPGFKIISKVETNATGEFVFDNLIFRNATAPIYLYFRTKDMMGDANYQPVWITPQVNKFAKPVYFFKNDYDYATIQGFSSLMEGRNSTLKGRVISDVNVQKGLNQATVTAKMQFSKYADYVCQINTDSTGKFDFKGSFDYIFNGPWGEFLTQVKLEVYKAGFHYMENGVSKARYTNTFDKAFFEKGKQVVLDNIILYSNGSIKGRIVNETGSPVDAFVQFLENSNSSGSVESGEMIRTGGFYSMGNILNGGDPYVTTGKFELPAIQGNNRKLVVIPKDVTYFADTIPVNVLISQVTDIGDIKVYERQHRIYFYVKKSSPGGGIYSLSEPVAGAKVKIIGSSNIPPFVSDATGKVVMKFKNVSESNLTLSVSGPTGSNFVPKTMAFTNVESETPVRLPDIYLEQGLTLKGKVLLDGKPTPDAEVFVELSSGLQTGLGVNFTKDGQSSTTESQYLFTAQTKADGTFEITTIPPELQNKQITVKAVYKKSLYVDINKGREQINTIIGESKPITVPETSGHFTLNLTTFKDMLIKEIWGFPLEITKLEKIANTNRVSIAGRVRLTGYSPGFDPLEPVTMEVQAVEFQPSDQKSLGIPIGLPVESKVNISCKRMLKLKYGKTFNVKLNTYDNSLFAITRENQASTNGLLNATVQVIDNSFQFPSSYLNFEGTDFYFCKPFTVKNTISFTPVIDVFNSGTPGNGSGVVKFNLCNLSGYNGAAKNLTFKFINFITTADRANSFIEGDEITLDATLHANVKNAGKVEVEIGKLVLKNNTISPVSSATPIMITLIDGGIHNADKEWKFEARNWTVDAKVGGLESKNCILHTGSIDIPYSYFNLRSDFAYLGVPDCKNLTMGGYPVTIVPGAEATTGFNASCGSDGAGHWQLIIHPPSSGIYAGKSPASVKNLPNMNATLEMETVSLLSNGENVFTLGTGVSKMKLYNVVDFKPQTIFALSDGFVLAGGVDFHIPRVKQNIGARLTFVKSAPDLNNPTPDPIDINFEAKGNVKFVTTMTGQKFNSANRTFTTFGTVEETGKLDPIQVLLTYRSNSNVNLIKTDIVESPNAKAQLVKIGDSNTSLEKVKCTMTADQTDWSLLKFEGDMLGFNGVDASSNKHMVFTVHGEIDATQDGFVAQGIDTPFGGLKISYYKGRLLGTLTMVNIPMGSVLVNGVANILMDSNGWAFYANCSADGVPAPEPCTVYIGILVGNYPSSITADMTNTVLKYSVKKEMPETFNSGLKGFFMVGGRDLPFSGLDVGIDVVVASAYVRIPVAAVDASFYGNFIEGNMAIGLGLHGKIQMEFGLEAITCTELNGSVLVEVYVEGTIINKSLNIKGGAKFAVNLTVSQGVPYPGGCIDAINISIPTLGGGFDFNLNPFDVKLYLGDK